MKFYQFIAIMGMLILMRTDAIEHYVDCDHMAFRLIVVISQVIVAAALAGTSYLFTKGK